MIAPFDIGLDTHSDELTMNSGIQVGGLVWRARCMTVVGMSCLGHTVIPITPHLQNSPPAHAYTTTAVNESVYNNITTL